ncbi:MAG: hypothetical protein QW609_02430 [Candidatus Aenigmatarchaeota archaeon]
MIVFYLVYEILKNYLQGFQVSSSMVIASLLLLILTLWFLLEKIGLIPSISGE